MVEIVRYCINMQGEVRNARCRVSEWRIGLFRLEGCGKEQVA